MTELSLSSSLITAAAALAGALIGYMLGPYIQFRRERGGVALAVHAEIAAIMTLVKERGYIEGFESDLEAARSGAPLTSTTFQITELYFQVYEANLGKIGNLDSDLAQKIPLFYSFLFAALEDVKEMSKPGFLNGDRAFIIPLLEELVGISKEARDFALEINNIVQERYIMSIWVRGWNAFVGNAEQPKEWPPHLTS